MKWLQTIHFERRPTPTPGTVLGVSTFAVLMAFGVVGLLLWGYGINPVRLYTTLGRGLLGDRHGITEVIRQALPLLLAGVGLVLAFRAQFWNIGAEGQILAGATAAAGVALFFPLPGPLFLPLMFLVGAACGALWSSIPAYLKITLGVNEVITTLMMNYIALHLVQWLIHGPWKGRSMRGFAYTDVFPEAAWLAVIPGTRLHWPTALLGLLLALIMTVLLSRTHLGYAIRVLGQSHEAARYAGINTARTTLFVTLMSGSAAGLAGVGEVAGIHHRLLEPTQISSGYGYTAIIVAWLARGHPGAAIATALLMGGIFAGGDILQVTLRLPIQAIGVINGLILLCLISSERLLHYRLRWMPKEAA